MERDEIRIVIIHRDGLYRDSLSRWLAQAELISVVHSAPRFAQPGAMPVYPRPDLLVVEFGLCCRTRYVGMKDRAAMFRDIKTIVIGVPDTDEEILSCIEVEGASGYVPMDGSLDDLLKNIYAVMRGETLCSPRIAGLAFGRMSALARENEAKVNVSHDTCFTRREAEIVRLIDEGLSNKEIASRLHIEVSTVKNHVHNILDKFQLHSRHSAVKYAKAQGLISTPF